MQRVKRSLTLLEVMIAFALTAILLTFLLAQFQKMSFASRETKKMEEMLFSKHLLQARLAQVFAAVVTNDKEPTFFLQEGKLYFHFDQGLDPVESLCNEVKASLFVDDKKRLILEVKALEGDTYREERLQENVSKIVWEFFEKNAPKWGKSWPREKKGAPPMIRLEINGLIYAFFLPGSSEPVTYKKGAGA